MFVTPAFAETAHGAAAGTETALEQATTHADKIVFPPFDVSTFPSQFLWLVITFGVLYFLMKRVIVPRVGAILEDRHDRIAQDLDEASRLNSEASAAMAAYERELAAARSKARDIAAAAAEKARAEADAERQKLESELAEKIAGASAHIDAVRAEALAEVGAIAEETTALIVTHLIGGRVAKADVASAVTAAKEG
ncbi:F0F1 ATP synthase subunit B [Martelella alba]|uniref:ATP synthase subunit b n=1 Tax=Martelella alba TaxID=2590451 RepID=A0A506U9V1_9HYPH|nr:F0F1 ATP synthase subunit B [Martelella alba]TPW31163.1 F0F1 ATP synthase subunit B [Martelella alba]